MDHSTQSEYPQRSTSPSYTSHSTDLDPLYCSLPPRTTILVDSYGNKSSSIQATAFDPLLAPITVADVDSHGNKSSSIQATAYDPLLTPITTVDVEHLLENSRALISDLSILNGEFASSSSPQSSIAILESSTYSLSFLCDFEIRVSRLLTKIQNDEIADFNGSHTPSDIETEDLRTKFASEHEKFEELHAAYEGMREQIQGLRCRLERENAGQYGFYEYELDIQYQVIGNQVIPPYYRKTKKKEGKKRALSGTSSSSPAPVVKKARLYRAKGRGEKVTKVTGETGEKIGEGGKEGIQENLMQGKDTDKDQAMAKNNTIEDLQADLERMKKERALLAIEVNALKAEKRILQS